MKDIIRIAYEKYKLDWLINHKYNLDDMFNIILSGLRETVRFNDDIENYIMSEEITMYDILIEETFPNQDMWVDISEFLNNEFLDDQYMSTILTIEEMNRRKLMMINTGMLFSQ